MQLGASVFQTDASSRLDSDAVELESGAQSKRYDREPASRNSNGCTGWGGTEACPECCQARRREPHFRGQARISKRGAKISKRCLPGLQPRFKTETRGGGSGAVMGNDALVCDATHFGSGSCLLLLACEVFDYSNWRWHPLTCL